MQCHCTGSKNLTANLTELFYFIWIIPGDLLTNLFFRQSSKKTGDELTMQICWLLFRYKLSDSNCEKEMIQSSHGHNPSPLVYTVPLS